MGSKGRRKTRLYKSENVQFRYGFITGMDYSSDFLVQVWSSTIQVVVWPSVCTSVVIIPPLTLLRHTTEKDIVTLGQGGVASDLVLTHSCEEEDNTSFFTFHSSSVQE